MRKLLLLLSLAFLTFCVNAQISVTVTNPTNTSPNLQTTYSSLASCLTDLNLVTAMTGPITITMDAGTTETAPPTGLTIGSTSLNAVLNATNTVTIVKASGTVTLNAGVGTATPGSIAPDGILKLVGADYVTIDGLTLTDGNIANPATMEFGIGLFKFAANNGCNNNTIQNCIFNMQRINNAAGTAPMIDGSVGILVINSTPSTATTALTPTNGGTLATNGTNSNNKFYNNIINGGNIGLGLSGYAATVGVGPTPTASSFLGDLGNDIGGSIASTGNTIRNFGGGAATSPAAGIRANNQWSINISYNTINNNDGSGVNHATTLRGIYGQAGTSASATINNNTITLKCVGTTTASTAIDNTIGATAASNTVNINNNTIQNCTYTTATTATFTAIQNAATAATVNMNLNRVINNTIGLSGTASSCTFYGIYSSATVTNLNINQDTITNNVINNQGGTLYSIRASTATYNVNGNVINNNSIPLSGGSLACVIYGYYNLASPTGETVQNNLIDNLTILGTTTSTSNIIAGIFTNTAAGSKTWSDNIIHTLTFSNSSTGAAVINGLQSALSTTINVFRNKIYNLSADGSTSLVSGILFSSVSGGGTANIYNNLIGDLKAPKGNNGTTDVIRGINITSTATTATFNIYYNTINLNATSTGVNFSTSGVFHTFNTTATTSVLNLRNNIIINLSIPTGTGIASALRRSASTNLNNYASTSNNNLFYIGYPSLTKLFYYDGTNSVQTLAAFKTLVSTREAASVSGPVTFLSTSGASSNFLHIDPTVGTNAEAGAVTIATYTTDFDGITRAGTPDIGADEFSGIALPACVVPTAQPTALVLTPTSSTTITGSFTTASPAPNFYMLVRTTANTLAASPVDGTSYAVGTNTFFGTGGYVESLSPNTTFISTGLTVGTTYYYWIFSYNADCSAGPSYLSVSPLTGNAAPAAVFTSIASGNWSDGSTWDQAGAIPASGNEVNIAAAHNVTLNGVSVASKLTIAATGVLTASTSSLTIANDISNSGTITASGAAITIGTTLTNASTGIINGPGGSIGVSGAISNSGTITASGAAITIGTSLTNLIAGSATTVSAGTVAIGTTFTNTTNTSALTVSGGAVTVGTNVANAGTITASSGSLTVAGSAAATGFVNTGTSSVNVSGGTITLGPVGGGNRTFSNASGTTLTVSSGTLNINGNYLLSSGGILTQSGGAINVDGNAAGVTANSVASGTILVALSSATLTNPSFTGGTFTIVDPHAAATLNNAFQFTGSTATGEVAASTAHTFRFGNGVSTDAGGNVAGFSVYPWAGTTSGFAFGNITIAGPTGTNRVVTSPAAFGALVVKGNLSIGSGGVLNHANGAANDNTSYNHLYVAGNIDVAATGSLISVPNALFAKGTYRDGSIIDSAASTNVQLITIAATATTSLQRLTVNNANTTLGGTGRLNVSGILTTTAGTLNGGGVLTLKSTSATSSARIAANSLTIEGNVNVERFIAGGRRAYRFLGNSFSTPVALSDYADDVDITGATGTAGGFSQDAPYISSSAYYYDNANGNAALSNDPGWTAYTSTSTTIASGDGLRVFVRGSKGQSGIFTSPYPTPNAVTITTTGVLNPAGSYIKNLAYTALSGYNMISNPFISPINLKTLTLGGAVNANYYIWNARQGTQGGYLTYTFGTGTEYSLPSSGSFIVTATGAGQSVTFKETDKNATDTSTMLREGGYKGLGLLEMSVNADNNLFDRFTMYFNKKGSSAGTDVVYDGAKFLNAEANLYSLNTNQKALAVDMRPYKEEAIIPLGFTSNKQKTYTIKVDNINLDADTYLFLTDKYLDMQIKLEPGTEYEFTVDGNPASQGENRFELSQKPTPIRKASKIDITLAPNPATDNVKVTFSNEAKVVTSIVIVAADGKVVKTYNAGNTQNGQLTIPVKGLAKGMYNVQVVSGSNTKTTKLIIQ